ncbi:MAG: hypothetical protein JXQ75_11735 [Phycisphaerae bacterium]|nr:hypothetical protein [Phycisphaerae bacterium]
MIVIGGRAKGMGILFCVIAAVPVLLPAALILAAPTSQEHGQEKEQERRRSVSPTAGAGIMTLVMAPCGFFFGFIGWRFYSGAPSLRIDADGLFFPSWPGARFGRRVRWEDLAHAEEMTAESALPRASSTFYLMRWCAGGGPSLRLEFNRPTSELRFGGWFMSAFCKLNEASVKNLFPKEIADRTVLEFIFVDGPPFPAVVAAINALAEDAELRQRYCTPDEEFVIRPQADGRISFESEQETHDWWGNTHTRE